MTGLGEFRKACFVTNLIFKIINDAEKIYIESPALHQDLYQKLIQSSIFIPIIVGQNNLRAENLELIVEEISNQKTLKNQKRKKK